MKTVVDPWVNKYERLQTLLRFAGVSEKFDKRIQKRIFLNHRDKVSLAEFKEVLQLFKEVEKI